MEPDQTIKPTGIELIAKEREEQITKHSRTIEQDVILNADNQLSQAAVLLLKKDTRTYFHRQWPMGWDEGIWNKMFEKPRRERLIIAGALIAAEIDRIDAAGSTIPIKPKEISLDISIGKLHDATSVSIYQKVGDELKVVAQDLVTDKTFIRVGPLSEVTEFVVVANCQPPCEYRYLVDPINNTCQLIEKQ